MKKIITSVLLITIVVCSLSSAFAAQREVQIVGAIKKNPAYIYDGIGGNILFNLANTNHLNVELRFTADNPWWPWARATKNSGEQVIGRMPIYEVQYTPNLMIASMFTSYTLQSGDRGTAIKNLQMMLERVGHDPQGTDGIWGSNTTNAVKSFQRAAGITVDGKVGPTTKLKLLKQAGFVPGDWNYS